MSHIHINLTDDKKKKVFHPTMTSGWPQPCGWVSSEHLLITWDIAGDDPWLAIRATELILYIAHSLLDFGGGRGQRWSGHSQTGLL